MGLTKITTKLTSLTFPDKCYEAVFLIDIDATDSMAPHSELEKIGVHSEGKMS